VGGSIAMSKLRPAPEVDPSPLLGRKAISRGSHAVRFSRTGREALGPAQFVKIAPDDVAVKYPTPGYPGAVRLVARGPQISPGPTERKERLALLSVEKW